MMLAGAATGLDRDLFNRAQDSRRLGEGIRGRGHQRRFYALPRQGAGVDFHALWLGVDRQKDVKRPRLVGVVDAGCAAPQAFAQRACRVQRVGLPHQRAHLAEDPLIGLRHLLHVISFTARRLVPVNVIDTDPVRRRRERARHGLQAPRPDGRDHRRRLACHPGMGGCGMGHFHLVATVHNLHDAFLVVDAQYLSEIGRAMAENCIILCHALFQQPDNQRFRQRQFDDASAEGRIHIGLGQPGGPSANFAGDGIVHFGFIKHRL